jgi:hypothetical protein
MFEVDLEWIKKSSFNKAYKRRLNKVIKRLGYDLIVDLTGDCLELFEIIQKMRAELDDIYSKLDALGIDLDDPEGLPPKKGKSS